MTIHSRWLLYREEIHLRRQQKQFSWIRSKSFLGREEGRHLGPASSTRGFRIQTQDLLHMPVFSYILWCTACHFSSRVSDTHVGTLDWVPSSRLQPRLVRTAAAIWSRNQWMRSVVRSLSLSKSKIKSIKSNNLPYIVLKRKVPHWRPDNDGGQKLSL